MTRSRCPEVGLGILDLTSERSRKVKSRKRKPTSGHQERPVKVFTPDRRERIVNIRFSSSGNDPKREVRGGPGGGPGGATFLGSGGRQILLVSLLTNVSNRSRFGSQEAPGRFGPFWGPSGGPRGRDGSEGPTTDAETTDEGTRVERHVRSDTRR